MNILGFVGYTKSGKSTIADYLCENHGYVQYALASPLKRICQELFDLNGESFDNTDIKESPQNYWGIPPREILHSVGTEFLQLEMPTLIPEVGAKLLHKYGSERTIFVHIFNKWYNSIGRPKKLIISDIRWFHEFHALKNIFPDMKIIKIIRDPIRTRDEYDINALMQFIKHDTETWHFGNFADKDSLFAEIEKKLI